MIAAGIWLNSNMICPQTKQMHHVKHAFLRLSALSKSYTEGGNVRKVLENVSINFCEGEFTAILGKSGTGKTTLLNIISGIDKPDSGEVLVEEKSLTEMDDLERTLFRRRNIGFVFQFYNLIPTLTVWENVTLPLELNGMMGAHDRERASELLDEVGLLDRKNTFPERLSGGEQQRVAIARALVHDPLLLLADEPTGNLDEGMGLQIMQMLDRLTRKAGKNLILVTHSRATATFADRTLTLHEGQLLEGSDKPL